MPVFNYPGKEVNIKIVYYGPGLSGKTTNIQYIHENIRPDVKGKLVSLATQTDRTLFFDFLPMELGTLGGYKIRLHLYTVPGQVHYNATRKLVLKGVDGVVLVVDSQKAMKEANLESLDNLEKNLRSYGKELKTLPHIIQGNKRDLDELLSIEELNSQLNRYDAPFMEAVASNGDGVLESLREILKLVMRSLKDQFPLEDTGAEDIKGAHVEEKSLPEKESVTGDASVDVSGDKDRAKEPPPPREISVEPVLPEEAEIPDPVQAEEAADLSSPGDEVPEEFDDEDVPGPVEPDSAGETGLLSTGTNQLTVTVPVPGGGEVELNLQISARVIQPSPVFGGESAEPDSGRTQGQIFEEPLEELNQIDELATSELEPVDDVLEDLDHEIRLGELQEPLGEPVPDPYEGAGIKPLPQELTDEEMKALDSTPPPARIENHSDEGEEGSQYDPSFEELEFSNEGGEPPGSETDQVKGKKKGLLGIFKKKD